jgi:ubiquitin-activating enzyme E1
MIFWSIGCNVVMNSLDHVEARLFVDNKYDAHSLGLVNAGTLGPKGNVQVIIPQESELYGSSVDPPKTDIPICTLKNFPYEISHTIQWVRDLFNGFFNRRPHQVNVHIGVIPQIEDLHTFGQSMIDKLSNDAAIAKSEELAEDLGPCSFIVGAKLNDRKCVLAAKKLSLGWAMPSSQSTSPPT